MARIWQMLGGSSLGGGTYVVRRLTEALLGGGHSVTVVSADAETARLFEGLGCRVVCHIDLDRAIRPLRDLTGVARLAALLRREGCDLLHTHTSKGGVVGRVAGRLAGVRPIVHHVHGFAFDPLFTPPARFTFYAAIERAAAPLCDAMVFVNSTDLDLAQRLGILRPGRRAQVIYNGVDAPQRAAPVRVRTPASSVHIAFVGRLAPQKGVDLLLEAAAGLEPGLPWQLTIVGDGPLRPALEVQAAALLPAGVYCFLGHRPHIGEFLDDVDIVVLPSRWEGHSIAVLEAMAHGKAVLATAIKGNVETIQSGVNGVLAPPGDAGALCSALRMLIENPGLRHRLGAAARQTVVQRFPADRMIQSVLDLYASLGVGVCRRGVPCAP